MPCASLSTFFDRDAALVKDLGKDNALGCERGLIPWKRFSFYFSMGRCSSDGNPEAEPAGGLLIHQIAIQDIGGGEWEKTADIGPIAIDGAEFGCIIPVRALKKKLATSATLDAPSRQSVVSLKESGQWGKSTQKKSSDFSPDENAALMADKTI